jgi:hypothetical protein
MPVMIVGRLAVDLGLAGLNVGRSLWRIAVCGPGVLLKSAASAPFSSMSRCGIASTERVSITANRFRGPLSVTTFDRAVRSL